MVQPATTANPTGSIANASSECRSCMSRLMLKVTAVAIVVLFASLIGAASSTLFPIGITVFIILELSPAFRIFSYNYPTRSTWVDPTRWRPPIPWHQPGPRGGVIHTPIPQPRAQPHVRVGGGHFSAPPPQPRVPLARTRIPGPSSQPHARVEGGHFPAPPPHTQVPAGRTRIPAPPPQPHVRVSGGHFSGPPPQPQVPLGTTRISGPSSHTQVRVGRGHL